MALLPKPYPDEIVGSIMLRGRQHLGMPLKLFLSWIREVEGQSTSSFHLDSKVGRLAELCGCSPRDFLYNYTVFPYVVAFMPLEQVESLEAKLLSPDFNGTASSLIQNATYGSKHRRYCPWCAKEESSRYGETYWHRLHQLPGIFVCERHGCPLVQTNIKAKVSSKLDELSLPPTSRFLSSPKIERDCAFRLLACTSNAIESTLRRTGTSNPQRDYRESARNRGYVRAAGGLAAAAVATDLAAHFGSKLLSALDCEVGQDAEKSWPALLLRPTKGAPAAPIRHVLLRSFLEAETEFRRDPVKRKDYPRRDYATQDVKTAELLRAAIAKAEKSGGRLTVQELLDQVGIAGTFRHQRKNFPQCESIIQAFRRSALSARQLGGSAYWRARIPTRWGLRQTDASGASVAAQPG